jgi:hypothetical protein
LVSWRNASGKAPDSEFPPKFSCCKLVRRENDVGTVPTRALLPRFSDLSMHDTEGRASDGNGGRCGGGGADGRVAVAVVAVCRH